MNNELFNNGDKPTLKREIIRLEHEIDKANAKIVELKMKMLRDGFEEVAKALDRLIEYPKPVLVDFKKKIADKP